MATEKEPAKETRKKLVAKTAPAQFDLASRADRFTSVEGDFEEVKSGQKPKKPKPKK